MHTYKQVHMYAHVNITLHTETKVSPKFVD